MTEQTIYIGKLKTGQPLINLSGHFEMDDCELAFNLVGDLVMAGDNEIAFDCSGVKNVAKSWIERRLREIELQRPGLSIEVRKHFDTPNIRFDATPAAATGPGILDRISERLVRMLGLSEEIAKLKHQTS